MQGANITRTHPSMAKVNAVNARELSKATRQDRRERRRGVVPTWPARVREVRHTPEVQLLWALVLT